MHSRMHILFTRAQVKHHTPPYTTCTPLTLFCTRCLLLLFVVVLLVAVVVVDVVVVVVVALALALARNVFSILLMAAPRGE